MPFALTEAESILNSRSDLRELYRQKYELSFETTKGQQIALNRRAKSSARVWIEASLDPRRIGLSPSARFDFYPSSRPRAHLSAARLTGPYKPKTGTGRSGNDCWYVTLVEEADFDKLLKAYL